MTINTELLHPSEFTDTPSWFSLTHHNLCREHLTFSHNEGFLQFVGIYFQFLTFQNNEDKIKTNKIW